MPIHPLVVSFLAALPTLGATASEPPPAPPAAVNAPDDTYHRLTAIVDDFAALTARIDHETARADTQPKLFVNFGWLTRWSGPWPGDFAPREEFLALHRRVFAEAAQRGLLETFAQLADAPALDIPTAPPGNAAALNIDALRGLFEMNEYAFHRAIADNQPPRAVAYATAHLGLARLLLTTGAGNAAAVGNSETRRAVVLLMPLVARGSLDSRNRAALASSIKPIPGTRTQRVAAAAELLARAVPSQWESLPKALFADGPAAPEAWANLSDDARDALTSYVGPRPLFPLVSADAMVAEIHAAAERLKPWTTLPPMEMKQRAAQLKRGKDPVQLRQERLVSTLIRAPLSADEAALAVDALRTVLALEAFHDAHAGYPAKLDELVPEYLDAVPNDPGRPGSPLIYKRGTIALWDQMYPYVLYSRGSDGVDDNASAMREPAITLSGISTEKGKDLVLNAHHEKK